MINISVKYDVLNYASILNTCARQLNASVKSDTISLSGAVADGYIKVFSLPNGLEILIAECTLNEDVTVHRTKNANRFFVLRLHEIGNGDNIMVHTGLKKARHIYDKAGVTLSNAQDDFSVHFTKGVNIKILFILFDANWLQQHFNINRNNQLLKEYFDDYAKGLGYEKLDGEYARLMNLIIQKTSHPFSELYLLNRAMLLIERFFTRIHQRLLYTQTGHKLTRDDVVKLSLVEQELLKDLSKMPPTIAELASQAGMSSSKLKNNFKALYGMPVYKYYLYHKIVLAKEMLLSGEYAVKNVGLNLGYKNLSHFAAAFKKEMGVLPGELLNS